MTIQEAIRKLAGTDELGEMYGCVCKVTKVEGLSCEVEPVNGDAAILDVRLVAEESGNYFSLIPKLGSTVIVQFLNNAAAYVTMVSEVSEVFIKVGGISFKLTEGGIELNGGQLGGMVKVEALVNKINALESDLNTLKAAFNSWVIVPSDGGAALKTIAATWSAQVITQTVRADLENNKVKQ